MINLRVHIETTNWESWSSLWWLTGNHDSRSIPSRSILCSSPSWIVWKLSGRLGYKCGQRCCTGKYGRWIYSDMLGLSVTSSFTMRCVWGTFDFGRPKMVWSVHGWHMREESPEGSWWLVSVLSMLVFWSLPLKQVSYPPKVSTLPGCTCVHS